MKQNNVVSQAHKAFISTVALQSGIKTVPVKRQGGIMYGWSRFISPVSELRNGRNVVIKADGIEHSGKVFRSEYDALAHAHSFYKLRVA